MDMEKETLPKIEIETTKEIKNSLLKNIRDIINTLEEHQSLEILKILDKNDFKYTQNKNGIFLNMCKLDDNIIKCVVDYLKFINKIIL
jgi:hypothetical protein